MRIEGNTARTGLKLLAAAALMTVLSGCNLFTRLEAEAVAKAYCLDNAKYLMETIGAFSQHLEGKVYLSRRQEFYHPASC